MAQPAGLRVGARVRRLRVKYHVTQEEVCAVWGRPQTNLSRIENDRRGMSQVALDELVDAIHEAARRKALGVLGELRPAQPEVRT